MPNPVDPNTPLSITLTAGEWNAVLATLAKGRFNLVSPLIQKIVQQAQGEPEAEPRPRPHLQPAG
jgi:hypothetical protein